MELSIFSKVKLTYKITVKSYYQSESKFTLVVKHVSFAL